MWGVLAAWGVVGVSPIVCDSVWVDVSRPCLDSSLGGEWGVDLSSLYLESILGRSSDREVDLSSAAIEWGLGCEKWVFWGSNVKEMSRD